jgi:hypothetical protein
MNAAQCVLLQVLRDALPAYQRANLDMLIRVHSAAGATLATFNGWGDNSTTGWGVPASSVPLLSAAHYFVSVVGSSFNDPASTAMGFTDYGSLGQYTLTVVHPTFNGVVPAVPK